MKRVLLTGARGFIGRKCLPLLLSKGYEVHAVSRRRSAEMALPGVSWHERDLLKPGDPADLVREVRPDALLHLAWYAVPGKFWEARENVEWVRASLELLRAFTEHGGKRFTAAGSCAEYGSSAGECVEYTTPLLPNSLYATCKHALQQILQAWSRQTGLSSAWGRIFFLYGPFEHPSRIVAYVIRSLLSGAPALCSEGKQILDFLHVEDVASALVAVLESEIQGPVNIGSGKPIALRDVLLEIGRQTGRPELIHFGAREGSPDPDRFWANTRRLTKGVGWQPHYSLELGIQQTIEWWRSSAEVPARDGIPSRGE